MRLFYKYYEINIVNCSLADNSKEAQQFYTHLDLYSSLDKQCICANTQLKSSKKQSNLNVCVPKSNSVDHTYDVIAYHLVHFVSICVIYKFQLGIDFFLLASAQYNFNFMNKISPAVKYFNRKTLQKWMRATNVNKAMRFAPRTIKSASLILRKAEDESQYVGTSAMASSINNKKTYVITAKNLA